MKQRLIDWLSTILEPLFLRLDGHTTTRVRIKAVRPVPVYTVPTMRLSKERERMKHHCDIPPWGTNGGSYYCPLCRATRTYAPLSLPMQEVIVPHFVPRVRGRHDGHLRYTTVGLIDTGKLVAANWRP